MSYYIKPIEPGDFENLADFLHPYRNQFHKKSYWLERFDFWWAKNPSFSNGMPRGWLLTWNGAIAGTIFNIPLQIQINGTAEVSYCGSTWFVENEHRGKSFSLLKTLVDESVGRILWMTTPGKTTTKILSTLHFQLVPRSFGNKCVIYSGPGKYLSNSLEKYFPGGKFHFPSFVVRTIDSLNNVLRSHKHPKCPYEVKFISKANQSFDLLWDKTSNKVPVTRVRTSRHINWYCFGCSSFQKILLGCFDGDELVGYAVFRKLTRPDGVFLECLDLWHDPSKSACPPALFQAAYNYAIEGDLSGLLVYDYPQTSEWLDSVPWSIKNTSKRNAFFLAPERHTPFITGESSYFTLGEGDVGL